MQPHPVSVPVVKKITKRQPDAVYEKSHINQQKFEYGLLEYIVLDGAPLVTCERPGFKNLIWSIDAKLYVPHRRKLGRMLNTKYSQVSHNNVATSYKQSWLLWMYIKCVVCL